MLENRMLIDSEWPEPVALPYAHCCKCGDELQCGNDSYEADEAYEIDGSIYCEDCFVEVVKSMYRTRLEA